MEEVRSYWQVTSIHHFCTKFAKPFKLPTFEPEELDQAFILDIPTPAASITITTTTTTTPYSVINNIDTNINSNNININNTKNDSSSLYNGQHDDEDKQDSPDIAEPDSLDHDEDEDYKPPNHVNQSLIIQEQPNQAAQQQADEQKDLHLLVRLAIALMKPHFNCKLTQKNWEHYLHRLVDKYWVDLEHCPSPFTVPLISQDGVELTKNFTFNELPLSDKIDLFYALCDYRLWCEDVTESLKDYSLEELRLESIGKDSQGYEYWYFSGTRLFRENKELSQDLIVRKKRIKELEYKLIDLEKARIFREQEEKRKAESEKARQLAAEAREARLAAKKNQEQETLKKKKLATLSLPPRTGLRERRSSSTGNNNDSQQARNLSTRSSKISKQQPEQTPQQGTTSKTTRSKSTRQSDQRNGNKTPTPDLPKKSPEEECKEELQKLAISKEDRAEAWFLQCDSLESWENFLTKFEKTKSTNEKYLSSYIERELLPHIRNIYNKRAADAKKKEKELLLSLTSRRVSTRIISKRAQEEEDERQAQLHEAEMRRKKVEAETRLRAELEREIRAKKNRQLLNGGTSSTCSEDGDDNGGRYNFRHQLEPTSTDEFGGIIHPDKLSEFYEAVELVIDTVRTSKHAWPFVDPVPETVPGYYDLIEEPMDLRKLRRKIEFREYKSLIELEKDFQLIVNNCEKFNGPKNVYTKMVYKLWKSFRKNVQLYLQRDLIMDVEETFIYPPVIPPPPLPPQKTVTHQQPSANHQTQVNQLQPVVDYQNKSSYEHEPETANDNHAYHQIQSPMRDSLSPCPPQMSPVNSPQPPEASSIHGINQAISSPTQPKTLQQRELTVVDPKPIFPLESTPPIERFKDDPVEAMSDQIIIDSYDVTCPDDNFFIWPQDTRSDETIDN